MYHLVTSPPPVEHSDDLRPARQALGLTLTDVATALDCSIGKISQLERGTIRDVRFLHNYRHWLTTTIQPQNAA